MRGFVLRIIQTSKDVKEVKIFFPGGGEKIYSQQEIEQMLGNAKLRSPTMVKLLILNYHVEMGLGFESVVRNEMHGGEELTDFLLSI